MVSVEIVTLIFCNALFCLKKGVLITIDFSLMNKAII